MSLRAAPCAVGIAAGRRGDLAVLVLVLLVLLSRPLFADPGFHTSTGAYNVPAPIESRIGFDEHPGAAIPGSLAFHDESGRTVTLSSLIAGKPAVLGLVYYGCPNLCGMEIDGLFKAAGELSESAGRDYSIVLVSIDPDETPELAAKKRARYLGRYGRAGAESGVHFLTGDKRNIDALASSVGFRYLPDPAHHQFAHPSGVVVLDGDGKIGRYLFGIDFPDRSLHWALLEARGLGGTPARASVGDRLLLYCYHYDPATGTYSFAVQRALSIAAAASVAILAFGIFWMVRSERKGGVS